MKGQSVNPNRNGERGMIMILMAIAIVGLIGAGSLAVDIGSALVTKTELQNVADASTLAATRELALIYKALPPDTDFKEYTLTTDDETRIQNKALAFAAANKAGGVAIVVGNSDIVTATYDISTGETTPSKKGVRAVEVTGRRDDNQNGQLQTALGRVLGINQIAVTADSTAAISAVGKLRSGEGDFPIGIDEDWFADHTCASPDKIQLYPTASCAGWHTFTEWPPSAQKLNSLAKRLEDGTFQSPETVVGMTLYNFNGGTVVPALRSLEELFISKGGPGWVVNVPVYKKSSCANPNGPLVIVGFVKASVLLVKDNPDGKVEVDVQCGVLDEDQAEGGGPSDFGTLVGTPGMIH